MTDTEGSVIKVDDQLKATTTLDRFIALSNQVHLLRPSTESAGQNTTDNSKDEPDIVLIYGWGDAQLKHVAKFADGYNILFPSSKIIVLTSPLLSGLFRGPQHRHNGILPLLKEAFGPASEPPQKPSVLAHVLSNTGLMYFTAMLEAYKRSFGRPMPHSLVVMDSVPGSMEPKKANIGNLADTLAAGAGLPWPPVITKALIVSSMYVMGTVDLLGIRENPVTVSMRNANDAELATTGARRVYVYSKEDPITLWEAVEEHAADAREKGYAVECELSEGSGHVEHMRKHPERYWHLVKRSWEEATAADRPVRARL
ncbi:indole-diterpene biosynthesis protein [Colletotrichum sojae]|uniref:Indole-diterpene biosynthesis protein n=1 Tax=Colletotrichum sojae TaxID=2175907 RepID=A0A8H6MVT4_9PEZI|nr:indole-diterpene biosynthesis protein [Colletotrichum sojae]